ncbi:hypothetical protein Tco_0992557 [Tanacetum coccineum]|uniref:Uncharacterized protein n=1 Tax=Tanacetum coccineum TaxID=301880 RepID=A0ABQ5F345_9ASTR
MNKEEIRQVTALDEKWVPTKERVKISTTKLDWILLCHRRKKLFKLSSMSSRTLPTTRNLPFLLKSLKYLCSSSGTLSGRIQGVEFAEVSDDESTLTFLIDLGYKGPLYKYPSMFVDNMHQPWRNLAAIINKYLFGKSTSNDRLRKSRINILWGMFHRENVDYPELIWEDFAFQIDNRQLKKGRRKIIPYRSRIVIKRKVSISIDDNIIPEPYIALKLGKSISLTKAAEEEATRQVHATHARIVTESVSEQQEEDHQGVLTLTPEEKLAVDRMQVLKDSKKISRRQLNTRGLSEGTGVSPGVPDESTVIPATSSEGTSAKPGVPDEEKVTSEPNVILDWGSEHESEYTEEDDYDENIEWVDTDEEEEKNDDDDDIRIDLEQTDDEETNNEFMHGEEHVQDDDEETDDEFVHGDEQVNDDNDKEMTNAEDADTGTMIKKLLTRQRQMLKIQKKQKDDIKEPEFPPLSFSLLVSSCFGNQFLNLSFDKSTVGNLKDSIDAEINSLLEIQI